MSRGGGVIRGSGCDCVERKAEQGHPRPDLLFTSSHPHPRLTLSPACPGGNGSVSEAEVAVVRKRLECACARPGIAGVANLLSRSWPPFHTGSFLAPHPRANLSISWPAASSKQAAAAAQMAPPALEGTLVAAGRKQGRGGNVACGA